MFPFIYFYRSIFLYVQRLSDTELWVVMPAIRDKSITFIADKLANLSNSTSNRPRLQFNPLSSIDYFLNMATF